MSEHRSLEDVIFYTRSTRLCNRQIAAIMKDGTEFRFSYRKMKLELAGYDLSELEFRAIKSRAYRKALAFVPELDKYSVKDSTGYYRFPNYGRKHGPAPVSARAQRDLDIVQNLLCELQSLSVN